MRAAGRAFAASTRRVSRPSRRVREMLQALWAARERAAAMPSQILWKPAASPHLHDGNQCTFSGVTQYASWYPLPLCVI